MSESIEIQLSRILNEYGEEVRDSIIEAIDEVAVETRDKLKATSPRRTGKYAKSWKIKKESKLGGSYAATVYSTRGQLTHLLENGHVIKNKKGTFGRTNGIKHIKPVEDWANEELIRKIERKIEK